ncbi:hypothetical protein [Lacinutrix jangbogonensis]|uniref:hypothetical protein n=1 Tax=Lacinutrix jangbogonensis TaxID=1469557 RepID=UPI00053DD6FA|nr:hypothetical protein [Lacinutrix jangbogonensis]
MKTVLSFKLLKRLFILPLIALTFLVSCQKEETEIVEPDQNKVITEDTNLSFLINKIISEESINTKTFECIEFQYPLSFSIYNPNFQIINTVIVTNDNDFYVLFDAYIFDNDGAFVELNYPVSLILEDGSIVSANDNQELENVILAAFNDCFGWVYCDDLQAYVGDDCDLGTNEIGVINADCGCEEVVNPTFDCETLQANIGDDCELAGTNEFGIINADCECEEITNNTFDCETLQANIGDDCELAGTNEFGIINADCECEEETNNTFDCETLQANIGDDCDLGNNEFGVVNADCECEAVTSTTCSESDVNSYMLECIWKVTSYNNSNNLIVYDLDFESNGDIVITDTSNNNTYSGDWGVIANSTGTVFLDLANINGPNIQAIFGNWSIVECDTDVLAMERGSDTMIMEQDCN